MSSGGHSGSLFINQGTVQLGANNALYDGNFNDSNALTVAAGATLDLNGHTQFVGPLYYYNQYIVQQTSMTPSNGVTGGTVTSSTGYGNLISVIGQPSGRNQVSGVSVAGANVGYTVLLETDNQTYYHRAQHLRRPHVDCRQRRAARPH